ncbi:hypothetical protein SEA_ANON_30 [Gordonia phage Anon]|nr:hypothetical protein SEA_ANON_30 [Gordonia phage Anon]
MTPFNPDSIGDYVTLISLAAIPMIGGVATVALPIWAKMKKIEGHAESANEQVSNTHSTNLRDDIDRLAESIEAGFAESRTEFRLIQEALNLERRERMEGDLQLKGKIEVQVTE